MKKLHLLISMLIVTIPLATHTRLIEIVAEDGISLHVSASETVQDFFDKCRKDGHCTSPYKKLLLDFNNKIIQEGSYEATQTLWYHSSLVANTATVATLKYPQRKIDNKSLYQRLENTFIDIEAPNGRIKRYSLNETPAFFFSKCRRSGDCRDAEAMTLNFGNFEIREDSTAANRSFGSFNTDSVFAQVKKR